MKSNYAFMSAEQLLDESAELNSKLNRIESQLCYLAGCKSYGDDEMTKRVRDAVRNGAGWSLLLFDIESHQRLLDSQRDYASDGELDRLIDSELRVVSWMRRVWNWIIPFVFIGLIGTSLYVLDVYASRFK